MVVGVHVRIGMPAGLGLHLDVVGGGAFDEAGHVLGRVGPGDGGGTHGDVEVVAVDPGDLVKRSVGIGNTASAAVADGVEAVAQCRTVSLTHDGLVVGWLVGGCMCPIKTSPTRYAFPPKAVVCLLYHNVGIL